MKKIFIFMMALIAICGMTSCVERIDAGYEGVQVSLAGDDKGEGVSRVTGWVFYNPGKHKIYEYPLFVHTVDYDPITTNSKDGTEFTVDPTISIRMKPGSSPFLIKKYRNSETDIVRIIKQDLQPHVKDAAIKVFNKFPADSIISNRETIDQMLEDRVKNILDKEGFILEQITPGIGYPQSYKDAIDAKNIAIQNEMRIANEVKVAEANAKKAEAEAQITIAKAKAEAEANRLKTQTITPLLLQQMWIEKWSGDVPQVMGSNGSIFYDLNGRK